MDFEKELLNTVDTIILWGQDEIEVSNFDGERLLAKLYHLCFYLGDNKVDDVNLDPPAQDYKKLWNNVAKNFPDFGYYHSILNMNNAFENPNCAKGDAIDDLCEIIIDLTKFKWYYVNATKNDAFFDLKNSFENHFGYHLLDLLQFIRKQDY